MLAVSLVFLSLAIFTANAESKEAWGYVNVRPNAYMFWWLYYTDISADYAGQPLVIWLQGGPGASSVGYGNFMEIGPLDVNLQPRNETWINHFTSISYGKNSFGVQPVWYKSKDLEWIKDIS